MMMLLESKTSHSRCGLQRFSLPQFRGSCFGVIFPVGKETEASMRKRAEVTR